MTSDTLVVEGKGVPPRKEKGMKKERLKEAVQHGPFARQLVEALAEAAKELAAKPTEDTAHVFLGLLTTLEHTAVGKRWV